MQSGREASKLRGPGDADTEGVRIAMEAEDDTLRDVAIGLDENDLGELLRSI